MSTPFFKPEDFADVRIISEGCSGPLESGDDENAERVAERGNRLVEPLLVEVERLRAELTQLKVEIEQAPAVYSEPEYQAYWVSKPTSEHTQPGS